MRKLTEADMARYLTETRAMGPALQAHHLRQHYPDLYAEEVFYRCIVPNCEEPPQAPFQTSDGSHWEGWCATHSWMPEWLRRVGDMPSTKKEDA